MGVLIVPFLGIGNADLLHDIERDLLGLLLVLGDMQQSTLVDLFADGVHRVERDHGFLKDHGGLAAPDCTNLLASVFETQQILDFSIHIE